MGMWKSEQCFQTASSAAEQFPEVGLISIEMSL